ncbi:hypothetical protein HRR79_004774 [Exophiala dermatitidis]|nr:hypothetical protein HRR79_004774 [Exophiala dermatitidis]
MVLEVTPRFCCHNNDGHTSADGIFDGSTNYCALARRALRAPVAKAYLSGVSVPLAACPPTIRDRLTEPSADFQRPLSTATSKQPLVRDNLIRYYVTLGNFHLIRYCQWILIAGLHENFLSQSCVTPSLRRICKHLVMELLPRSARLEPKAMKLIKNGLVTFPGRAAVFSLYVSLMRT